MNLGNFLSPAIKEGKTEIVHCAKKWYQSFFTLINIIKMEVVRK
jgi:hypothetical protein